MLLFERRKALSKPRLEATNEFQVTRHILTSEHAIDPERITPDADLGTDLGLERPEVLELIMTVEEALGIDLPDGAFIGVEFRTIAALTRLFVKYSQEPHDDVLPKPDSGEVRSSNDVEAADHAPGDVIDERFEIVELIGKGGFSKVYRVFDAFEGEVRALKLFNNAAHYDAVRRELSALRKINHPNVVQVFWADKTIDGDWYLIMEYIEGTSLSNYAMGTERMSDSEAVAVVLDVLNALMAIHPDEVRLAELRRKDQEGGLSVAEFRLLGELQDRAMVHRDIKPQNVMLTPVGAKVLDFNIASRVGAPSDTWTGTPGYMAPDHDYISWDVSTDLFAVGVVLYQLLCLGNHPYSDGVPAVDKIVIDPRRFRSDLEDGLVRFLLKACAPRREDRFSTSAEMAAELSGIQSTLTPVEPHEQPA
jgi:serine/threonine protein kinase/acyl carrier protein